MSNTLCGGLLVRSQVDACCVTEMHGGSCSHNSSGHCGMMNIALAPYLWWFVSRAQLGRRMVPQRCSPASQYGAAAVASNNNDKQQQQQWQAAAVTSSSSGKQQQRQRLAAAVACSSSGNGTVCQLQQWLVVWIVACYAVQGCLPTQAQHAHSHLVVTDEQQH